MGELTLFDALESIESGSIKERSKGLADLKHVLRHNQRNPRVGGFKDSSFHKIYEVLFKVASTERSTYLKSLVSATKAVTTAASNRLAACASSLRLAVELGVRNIKLKTVKALLDHITETLIEPQGGCCQPLALDYAKCFSTILAHQPHVEHLSEPDWVQVSTFCLDRIRAACPARRDDASLGASNGSSRASNGPHLRTSRMHNQTSQAPTASDRLQSQLAEEFVACLRHLANAPSAPLTSQAQSIFAALISYLEIPRSSTQPQTDSLAVINSVLTETRTEAMATTRRFVTSFLSLARDLWSSKSVTVKDELLTMLVFLLPYICQSAKTSAPNETISYVETLVEVIQSEYSKRTERDQLQLDDVILRFSHGDSGDKLSCYVFKLRDNNLRAEHNWAVLMLVATLSVVSRERIADPESEDDDARNYTARKRTRRAHWSDELLQMAKSAQIPARIYALQAFTFIAQRKPISDDAMLGIIEEALKLTGDGSTTVASWAFLCLSSCGTQRSVAGPSFTEAWSSAWQVTSRAINSASTCRAACHLLETMIRLDLVSRQDVGELVSAICSSIDVNGPAQVWDSSCMLLTTVLSLSRANRSSGASVIAERMLGWLFSKWAPGDLNDRPHMIQQIITLPDDVLCLLYGCVGLPHDPNSCQALPIWGSVAQAWIRSAMNFDLTAYLLLEEETAAFLNIPRQRNLQPQPLVPRSSGAPSMSLLLGLCTAEILRAIEQWQVSQIQRASSTGKETITALCCLSTVGQCLVSCLETTDTHRMQALRTANEQLLEQLLGFLSSTDCSQDKVDVALDIFSHHEIGSGRVRSAHGSGAHSCTTILNARLSTTLQSRISLPQADSLDQDIDMMDMDEEFDTQMSGPLRAEKDHPYPRRDIPARYDITGRRSGALVYAKLSQCLLNATLDDNSDSTVSRKFVDYIATLSTPDILAGRTILANLPERRLFLDSKDLCRLLEHFSSVILASYDQERSEVGLLLILEVMASHIDAWSDPTNKELYDLGVDIYNWVCGQALPANLLSQSVCRRLGGLILELLPRHTDYGKTEDLPSVRTTLFRILRQGSMTVKRFIGDRIHTIFQLYTLATHDAVFDDLQESLPKDADWEEGIAMRIYIFSRLASKWHSLLRRAVYHIFETAAKVPSSSKHAARSITQVSVALAFHDSRTLFGLFASQLLYTWLADHVLRDIPFSIFGYNTLTQLIEDNEAEVYAQLLLYDRTEEVEACRSSLGRTKTDIIKSSFVKAVAYALSQDIATTAQQGDGPPPGNETRIRNLFPGREEYVMMFRANYPAVVAQVWISMQQDGSAEKAMEKRPAFKSASVALEKMKSLGASSKALPMNLQPSFKGKHVADQIDRICRRANRDLFQLFETPSFVIIARSFLDTLHPALGSLHACQVVHKLRLLVAVAGNTALQGYPIEMLLHTLTPLLGDVQCADDTIGILLYLYGSGRDYLRQNMPKLTGSAFLALLTIKCFIERKQDATTQESQFRSTVSKMQTFHDWLTTYLIDCQDAVQEKTRSRFVSSINACHDLTLPVSASKDQPGSVFLLGMLDDCEAAQPMVDNLLREEILSVLRHNFAASLSITEDTLEDDELSIKYANRLWASMRALNAYSNYEHWVAKVLGRAYAATGSDTFARTSGRLEGSFKGQTARRALPLGSLETMVQRLILLLQSNDRSYVGLAERTLRRIRQGFDDPAEAVHFEQMLPAQLVAILEGAGRMSNSAALDYTPDDVLGRGEAALNQMTRCQPNTSFQDWVKSLSVAVSQCVPNDPILGVLPDVLLKVDGLAADLFPHLVHLALHRTSDGNQDIRTALSTTCTSHFNQDHDPTSQKNRLLLKMLLYLRTQPIAQERVRTDRQQWLNVDCLLAAEAASRCQMTASALLFAESQDLPELSARTGRRSLAVALPSVPSDDLLLSIFKRLDDPDSFYGVEQAPTLSSVKERLDFEDEGLKGLMLHTAFLDASLRNNVHDIGPESSGAMKSLGVLNLNGLTHTFLSQRQTAEGSLPMSSAMLEAARKLGQWDIATPQTGNSDSGTLFNVLRSLHATTQLDVFRKQLDDGFSHASSRLRDPSAPAPFIRSSLSALAVMTEIDELMNVRSSENLGQMWNKMQKRQQGWDVGRANESQHLVSYRETLFGILSRNRHLRDALHVSARDARLHEVQSVICNSSFSRKHDLIQQSLSEATYLSSIVSVCQTLGLRIDAPAQYEAASILWKQGEIAISVKMLQELCARTDLEDQSIAVGRAGMLAQLGHQVATARLERPEEVIAKYLKPAIEQLKQGTSGSEAGRVFHEFASFCDNQLQNSGNVEDFDRLQNLRDSKREEMRQLDALIKSTPSTQKEAKKELTRSLQKAKMWFDLDDGEYTRARKTRDQFVQQSLQNYLQALSACDDFDGSVVRFFALWLEYAESDPANHAVKHHVDAVPSWKFVVLLNQQMSRLLHENTLFQTALNRLVTRICAEHPYHTVHHIFASCKSAVGSKDETAVSRNAAAKSIAAKLQSDTGVGNLFRKVWEADELYHRLAAYRMENTKKTQFNLRNVLPAYQMNKKVTELGIPPATLTLALRPAGDYRHVPLITSFRDEVKIASGISAPKILTARASDGQRYTQLFKGGNDDLRQDAIMEQVFGEVSKMLRNHKATRQRDLHIRTYKVLPLSSTSGIIEFVPDSIPLHDYVVPSHEKYHPSDLKWTGAREKIRAAQVLTKQQRVDTYRSVTQKYSPVLRHFFFERFEDPDEWFKRRLAYTRSTATISMLGYVLGLGDRHCHNILLDEKSGEVIHIDLGVAFEAGRVLPVPEVVPFRLTRDIVDGMGITRTEGVFRRCCEFTMEALREDKDSIMTLLNVLRYDPLYSWTVSPLRAKRMQAAQEEARLDELDRAEGGSRPKENEAGEAERALAVVEKKLSKTLSTAATVNELIQQATDERNLAVLFAGWAAYS